MDSVVNAHHKSDFEAIGPSAGTLHPSRKSFIHRASFIGLGSKTRTKQNVALLECKCIPNVDSTRMAITPSPK